MNAYTSSPIPTLGPYLLTKEIKERPYDMLYEGKNTETDERIFIQLVRPETAKKENFSVRFELLASLLPTIEHDNLVHYSYLGCENNVYFLIKKITNVKERLETLSSFDLSKRVNREQIATEIFESVVKGLVFLEDFKNALFKEGLFPDLLTSEEIYLTSSKGVWTAIIDNYIESFLYEGDQKESPLSFRFHNTNKDQLWQQELNFTQKAREPHITTFHETLYSLASLVYYQLTYHKPKGRFTKISEIYPACDPFWDQFINKALVSQPYSTTFHSFKDLLKEFQELRQRLQNSEQQVTPIKSIHMPEGMVLVHLGNKVELGTNDGPKNEQPAFKARIASFLMDQYPITCKQFKKFLKSYQPSIYSKNDDNPATLISWHMAIAYCEWRSKQEGLPTDTYRLPTEYEWEAAVRGVTGDQYPWGLKYTPNQIHCDKPSKYGTLPVYSLRSQRFGLCGLLGNMWEWTESRYAPHPFSEHEESGYHAHQYAAKGGCWLTSKNECRATLRRGFAHNAKRSDVGFRCIREIPQQDIPT